MKNIKKVYKFNINHSVIRQLSTHAYSGISLTSISNFISDNSWSIESLKDYLNNSTWSIDDLNLFKDIVSGDTSYFENLFNLGARGVDFIVLNLNVDRIHPFFLLLAACLSVFLV